MPNMKTLFQGNSSGRKRGVSNTEGPPEGEPDETTVLDENEGSIIMSLISQLRIGMDLHKVTFPTFVLEPRSMLERITDFMSYPELVFGAEKEAEAEERFLQVLRYYLSGWHNKPKGVKKPYNPVLGEIFRCRFDYKDGSHGYYVAEQVSHHPPISAFFFISSVNKVMIAGELRPQSKFLGNSVSTVMEGENRVYLLGTNDAPYVLTMPNMYARGILFGKMVLELGDTCVAKNDVTEYTCDLDFKTKGFFSGTYNAVEGKVKQKKTEVGTIGGTWSHRMSYTPKRDEKEKGEKVLFDITTLPEIAPKFVYPESEQEPNESRRLWSKLTEAIHNKDMDAATTSKGEVEDAQREEARKREEAGKKHVPRFFELKEGLWHVKMNIDQKAVISDPKKAITDAQKFIWPDREPE